MNWLCVMLGGAIGAGLRYGMVQTCVRIGLAGWGAIMVINILGGLCMGIAYTHLPPHLRALMMSGVLGGFTTFSAFALDVVLMLQQGRIGLAMLYITSSVVLCVGALWLGMRV